jgi:hypothetical protein
MIPSDGDQLRVRVGQCLPGPGPGPGRQERDQMSEVLGHVGSSDMFFPDIGLAEVQVAELNVFVEKVVEEARDEIRDKLEKLERKIRVNKERAKAFQNMSIFPGIIK